MFYFSFMFPLFFFLHKLLLIYLFSSFLSLIVSYPPPPPLSPHPPAPKHTFIFFPLSCSHLDVGRTWFRLPTAFNLGDEFEQLKSMLKVLKEKHGIMESTDSKPAKKGRDVHITISDVTFEFEDDVFEAALYASYVIQSDEVLEREKREAVLQSQLGVRLGEVVSSAEEEKIKENLQAALSQKSAQIFCKRVREFRANMPGPPLFLVRACRLSLSLLADENFSGTVALTDRMKEMDPAPYPEEGIRFSLLLGCKCACLIDELTIRLRDYAFPLAYSTGLSLYGGVILAEPDAPSRACRADTIEISPGMSFCVSKGMTPIKIYHDLRGGADVLEAAWGPAWDGVLQDVSNAVDMLTNMTVDPSPPLPFFDKGRYLRHGPLQFRAKRAVFRMIFDNRPQSNTNFVHLSMIDAAVAFHLGVLRVSSEELHAAIFFPAVLNGSPLLHWPRIYVECGFKWHCHGDDLDHHSQYPVAPRADLPLGFDSFQAFRSLNVTLDLTVTTANTGGCATALLYASTLSWLSRADALLSEVTRPMRRGKLFMQRVPPLKPSFGRHLARLNLLVKCPSLSLTYFNSYERHRGLSSLGKNRLGNLSAVFDDINHHSCRGCGLFIQQILFT